MQQACEYQKRRANDKIQEAQRRENLLHQKPVDITPKNEGKFPWSKTEDIDKFESEWSLKPVIVKGIFDHSNEIQVQKIQNGEKGVQIIAPFYTHLNEKGEECGILVNRGWVPLDFFNLRMHYTGTVSGSITGLLYRGDLKNKYSVPNAPTAQIYTRVDPYDFSLITQMKNSDEASKFMLLQIDTNDNARQILPSAPNAKELTEWRIKPERNEAYASLWKYLTFVGIFANTALWLYF